jgi:hypothetical protein
MDGGLGVDATMGGQEDSTARVIPSPFLPDERLTEIELSQTKDEESSRKRHRRLTQLESRRRWRESRREAREPKDFETAELLTWITALEQPAETKGTQFQECPAETLGQETPTDRSLYVFTDFFRPHASKNRRLIYMTSRPTIPSLEIWDTMVPHSRVETPPREKVNAFSNSNRESSRR